MQFGGATRRSIRYSIFVGVLAGSVFAGSGASAETLALASILDQVSDGNVSLVEGATYEAGDPTDAAFTSGGSTYFGNFSGTFAGNGATITGLRVPLFDSLGSSAETVVEDLTIESTLEPIEGNGLLSNTAGMNVEIREIHAKGAIEGSGLVGGLIGNSAADITNSSFSGAVSATPNNSDWDPNSVGGLIGYSAGNISNSTASGSVTGSEGDWYGNYAGGLAGISTGQITHSSSTSTVSGYGFVGGLVGYSTDQIVNSNAEGSVTNYSDSTVTPSDYIRTGGLVGESTSNISNSSARGNVTGSANKLGGLVGLVSGPVEGSFALGNVIGVGSGWDVGGLVGFTSNSIANSYSTGAVSGWRYVGGLVGITGSSITNSYVNSQGNIQGEDGFVGGLVGQSEGNVENSYVDVLGDITGSYNVGGLAGYSSGRINYSTVSVGGKVTAQNAYVGGLVGYSTAEINDSTADISDEISGYENVGGLTGYTSNQISNSYSKVGGQINATANYVGGVAGESWGLINNTYGLIENSVQGINYVGGLVGYSAGLIQNSSVKILGDITGSKYIGGLAGYSVGSIENSDTNTLGRLLGSHAVGGLVGRFENYSGSIENSDSNVGTDYFGTSNTGGLVGEFYDGIISNSYFAINNEVGVLDESVMVGYKYLANLPEVIFNDETKVWDLSELPVIPSRLNVINNSLVTAPFTSSNCFNNGKPYLIILSASYENKCSTHLNLEKWSVQREILETKYLNMIENVVGFKNETPLPKSALVAFVESSSQIEVAKVKAVEITPTANAKVIAKAGEALQISFKSDSKEPVELWVKSPDGTWLLAGVITFDKDGKAILPPLQFKNAGDYSLVLSKPSADSSKGSAPLNQTGSLLVSVS